MGGGGMNQYAQPQQQYPYGALSSITYGQPGPGYKPAGSTSSITYGQPGQQVGSQQWAATHPDYNATPGTQAWAATHPDYKPPGYSGNNLPQWYGGTPLQGQTPPGTGVGSTGWAATHPDYNATPGTQAWAATHPNYKPPQQTGAPFGLGGQPQQLAGNNKPQQ